MSKFQLACFISYFEKEKKGDSHICDEPCLLLLTGLVKKLGGWLSNIVSSIINDKMG